VIARQWRALARAERASEYVRHLQRETFPRLAGIAGFVDATILQRALPAGVEFVIVTRWDSLAAIAAFAGDDAEAAVVPAAVAALMLEYDARARHYEVIG
jgi:heme-degrading monooxygenase HmoA